MSNFARRHRRTLAGMLVGALALSVSPILGITGVASAADPLPPLADPIGDGNFCEGAPTTEPFTDVQPTDPSFDEIVCLVATELTQGTTPTTYSPNADITRRQMALFIRRVADLALELEVGTDTIAPLPAYDGTPDFSDHAAEEPDFEEAIGQLSQANIVGGFPDGTYKPGAPVSRRQMAAFINRLQEFLTGAPFEDDGDYFDDDNGDSGEANLDALAGVGIFQGDGAGNVFPGNDLTRRQMANILLRYMQTLFADGLIDGAFDVTPESLITVDPSGPAVVTVSGTPGTETGELALRTYTITVDDAACEAVDVGLIPFTNITDNGDGTFSFQDVDGQANRADGLGGTAARIETVNGVNPSSPNPRVDGDDYVNNVAVPANNQVTVTVNSQTANQAVALVAFCDTDNNNQLNLDENDVPTEDFGLGGAQLIVPVEAGDLDNGTTQVVLHLGILNLFTDDDRLFNYDANDEFDYNSSGVVVGNLSEAEFGEFLSGAVTGQIADPDLQSGLRGGGPIPDGIVTGDFVDFSYRTDPAGVSSFEIVRDVPAAPTNLVAAIGDPDGDGTNEVSITWDGVSNPDLEGYNVFVQEVINGIPDGDWVGPINNTIVEGESFVGEIDTMANPFFSGGVFQIVVLAENGFGDFGPDSNVEEVTIPVDAVVRPPVVELTDVIVDGNGFLDDDDALRLQFQIPMEAPVNGDAFGVKDLNDGESATLTCGTNVSCALGANNTITITLLADLTPTGGVGGDGMITLDEFAFESATGINAANAGLPWHLAASAADSSDSAPNLLGADDGLTVVVNLSQDPEDDNASLPDDMEDFDIDVQDDSPTLTVDDTPDGDIEDGDVINVYDLTGTLLGTSVFSDVVGAQINVGMLPAGTPLFVQYVDANWAGDGTDVRSESTLVFVLGDAPVVTDVFLIDANTIYVEWSFPDPPLTQVKPPSAYTVFDNDNTDLVATGTAVELIDGDSDGLVDDAIVDLDANLTNLNPYFLRVQAATVQNNNNVPNNAQAFAWFADLTDFGPSVDLVTGPGEDQSAITNDTTPTWTGEFESFRTVAPASVTYEVRTDPGGVLVESGSVDTANYNAVARTGDFTNTTGALADGDYSFEVFVTDSAGVVGSDSVDFTINNVPAGVVSAAVGGPGSVDPNDIMVNFSEPVDCNGTANDNSATGDAFSFDDLSIANDDDFAVNSAAFMFATADPAQCGIHIPSSMTAEDFGTLTYQQPVAAGNRIQDDFGGDLPGFVVTVDDLSAPAFSSIVATAGAVTTVDVTLSEAIDCADIAVADFTATITGTPAPVISVTNCAGGDSTFTLTLGSASVAGNQVVVTAVTNQVPNQQGGLFLSGFDSDNAA